MSKRFLRGDAPTQAQQWRIKEPLIPGEVALRIGNKTLTFEEWDADAIVAAWSASKWSEFRTVTASISGDDVILTAKTAGVPFWVWLTVGGVSVGQGSAHNEVQVIQLINDPTGGTWNAAWGGDDVDIAWNASAATVQTALLSLDSLEGTDVAVSGSAGGPWTVTFGGRYAGQGVDAIAVDGTDLTGGNAEAVIRTVQDFEDGASGDTTAVCDNAGNVRVYDAGENLLQAGIAFGRHSSGVAPFSQHGLLWFPLTIARGVDITTAELSIVFDGFLGLESDVDFTLYFEAADNPAFPADGDDAIERPLSPVGVNFTIPAAQLPDSTVTLTGLAAALQAIIDRPGWESGNSVQVHLRATAAADTLAVFKFDAYSNPPTLDVEYGGDLREIQGIALSGNPRGGTVTISLDGNDTGNIPSASTAADVQAELAALPGMTGLVICTGGPWPAEIVCGFDVSLGDLPEMTATDDLVNGDIAISTTVQGGPDLEIQVVQRSRGPNHADDPLNWDDGAGGFAVPENEVETYCRDGKVDLLYGLRWRSTFTVSTTTDRLLLGDAQVALWNDQAVEVKNVGGGLPAGLAANTTYYVRDFDGLFCRLSTTRGGLPINVTTAGTGTHTLGVRLALFATDGRYTGKLGLPRTSKETSAPEYRPRFLEAWIDEAEIAPGTGSGSARCHLDVSGHPVTYHQHKSAGGTDGAPAGQLICTGAGNELLVLGGELGIAIDTDQAAEFDSLKVRSGNVTIGPGVTVGDIERTGGSIVMNGCTVNGSVSL